MHRLLLSVIRNRDVTISDKHCVLVSSQVYHKVSKLSFCHRSIAPKPCLNLYP